MKKEKNGLAALLLVFALFDITGYAVVGVAGINVTLLAVAFVSIVVYVILKTVKKRTSWLDEAGR